MTDQIEQLLKTVKARTGTELQSELETLSQEIDDFKAENEQLREEKASLQTELEKTTQGTLQLASELEQEYQHLFENAVEGIYKTTEELDEYVLANPAFVDLLGYESEEAVCEAIDSIEEDVFVNSDRYRQYAETLDTDGEINQFEYQVRTAEGETRWVSDSMRALRDDQGGVKGYRGAVIDITEKKTQEVELERQTQLSIVLNRVLRHNLRNDINVVRGYTHMMADQLDDTTHGEKALNTIDSLVELSEKARVLDKIISNDADSEPTDIPALVEAVASQMGEENPSATISVETPNEGITAEAIPSFKRAIEEIVENAVKHSGDSPRVEITIEANPKDIQIRIADNGPGIGEQDASVLLSESETPLKHGSGLGLWLINWIVTSVGGVIDVTATEEGTTLSVSLPRAPSEGNQKQMTDMVRARDQYKSAFEEAGDGMTITDDKGHILDLNNKAAQSFGEDREAMIGRPIREFMPEEFDFVAEWGESQAAEMKRGEIQIATADGGVSPIEYTAKSHFVPGQHLIVSRDISERKEREQEINELKNQLQGILDTAAAAIFVKDSDGRYLQMNRHCRDVFGVSEADVPGLTDDDLFPEDVAAQYQADDERVIENNESVETEEEVPTEDGTRTYLTRKAPISDKDGNTYALVAVATDITERKERQRRYEAIFNQTNKFTGLLEPDGTVIEANDPALEFGGLDREDVVGKQFHEAGWWQHDDAIQQELQDAIDRAAVGEFVRYEVEVQGSEKNTTIDFSIRPITDEQGNVTVLVPEGRDITERKERERELQETKERLGLALKGSNTGVWEWEFGSDEVVWSESMERLFRLEPGSFEGTFDAFKKRVHPDDRQEIAEATEASVKKDVSIDIEFRIQRADGEQRWVESRAEIHADEEGPDRMVGITTDISERKARNETLELRTQAIDEAPIGITISDPDQEDNPLIYVNDAFVEMTGYPRDEVLGRNCRALQGENTDPDKVARMREAIDAEESVSVRLLNDRKDGTEFWNDLDIAPVRDDSGEVVNYCGFQRDVSDRKEREQEIQELNQRLEDIVDLAPEPIWAVDNSGTIIQWNGAAEDAFGYPAPEAIGEGIQSLSLFDEEQRSEFEERFERVLDGETIRGLEVERTRKDGTVVQLSLSATPLRDGSDSVAGVIGAGQDVTDLKEREQKIRNLNQQLREERQRYESLFTSVQDAILVADTDREIINCNPAFEELFGYELAEIKGKHTKFVYESEAEYEEMGEAIEGHIGDPQFTHPVTYETKSGETFSGETSVFYLRNPEGEIAGFIGVIRDLTDLEEIINRLDISMGGTSTGVWGWDGETDRIHWSDSIEELIGFDRETIDSSIEALASYVHPADREDFLETFEAAIKKVGRVVTEVRIQREDGTQIWVKARGNVQEGDDGNKQMVGIITDITDRKQREEELIQYEAAFKKAGDGMTITDDEARILDVNEAAAQLYGEDKQELVGRSMKEFLPDDFDFEAEWGEIRAAKMKRDEMQILSADGGVNPVEYTAKTDIVPGQHLIVSRKIASTEIPEQQKREGKLRRQNERLNEFASAAGVHIDINDRKEDEEELERTSQFLKDSQEVAHFGGWEVNLRSETMRWSDELYRIHGLPLDANPTPEEGLEFYHPDDRDTIREAFDQLTTEGDPYDLELRIVTADDEVRWVRTRGEPRYEDDDIVAVHGTFQDITERKEREQALQRQNSRLDEFASVISHDLRNPLNVAMSRTQLAQDEYDSDHLDITMEAIGRMESIIEDSLVLARKGQPVAEREWIQMQSFLADCWEMVETPDCSLDIDDRFEVDGERSRLKHVFENLFRNSVEHGNGKSAVRVGLLDATGFYVEDDGPGIPEDDRKKVLDAGFTTNEDGTGFGLAIVNRIAQAHGWDLTIADGIDGGVRFEFSNVDLRSQSEIPSD